MLHEVKFRSYNERDDVYGWIYVPAAEPAGIIQIVHGFGEHSRRYLRMIVHLMDFGFIVAADDHVGHGKTALENNVWSDWGDKGPHTMMEDEHTLATIVREKYPDLPYFMFGHSMGSFIARDYVTKYGDELAGAIFCGTCGVFPGVDEGIEVLQKAVDEGRGEERDPKVGEMLMGWMFERCEEGVTIGNEWICHDPYVQKDHAADPFDAFTKPTTNRSFLDFCRMIKQVTGISWAEKVPKDLPIYNIGGDQDPVGNYGEGIYRVTNWLKATGHKVETEVYNGYRHEIHNYEDIRDDVEAGIANFMYSCLDPEEEEAEEEN